MNLFVSSRSNLTVNKQRVELVQQNNYPWDGGLQFTVNPVKATAFALRLRVPGWAQGEAIPSDLYHFAQPSADKVKLTLNGQPITYQLRDGYAVLDRTWHVGDVVMMTLPMDVRRVEANPLVKNDQGKVALQRGPLMYCAEWADNQGRANNLLLPPAATFTATYRPGLLNGVTTLTATVPAVRIDEANNTIQTTSQTLTAIPYYAWANRGKGEMTVWFPAKVVDVELLTRSELQAEQKK